MQKAITKLGFDNVRKAVMQYAETMKVPKELHIDYVFDVFRNHNEFAPNFKKDRDKKLNSAEDIQKWASERIQKWVSKFMKGYSERISQRHSRLPGTMPDEAISKILTIGLNCNGTNHSHHIHEIVYAHRLAMSAENILGLLLEEFLFEKLSKYGWALAWGETISHVDFVNKDGFLLQVKNRSNSENSSSESVRNNTSIQRWYRVDAKTGSYQWDDLNKLAGITSSDDELDENKFQNFIGEVLKNNPNALVVEKENPWPDIVKATGLEIK